MKICFGLLSLLLFCHISLAYQRTYVGSTPAHAVVRDFLQISATDSIDFIRWKLDIGSGSYKIQCEYGVSQPGTPGFQNEKRVSFEGNLTQSGNRFYLKHKEQSISMLEVNMNILHFLDRDFRMLIGDGSWSYSLNNIQPVKVDEFNIVAEQTKLTNPLVFEGRTPCQQLLAFLGLNKSDACNKMKWYFLFYTNSSTGKPSYFLMNGIGYKKETMTRGSWQIVQQKGRLVYRLTCDKWTRSLDLIKGDDNIVFFIDGDGRLFVGDKNFSYTLNRRKKEYAEIKR